MRKIKFSLITTILIYKGKLPKDYDGDTLVLKSKIKDKGRNYGK